MLSGLHKREGLFIAVISCRKLVQMAFDRNALAEAPVAAASLGELLTCALLMGASMEEDDLLQVSIIGDVGIRRLTAAVDGRLSVRGTVITSSDHRFADSDWTVDSLMGDGHVQVVHGYPQRTGFVALRAGDTVTGTVVRCMAESALRTTAMVTEVKLDEKGQCDSAVGVLLERLPGCSMSAWESSSATIRSLARGELTTLVASNGTRHDDSADGLELILNACLPSAGSQQRRLPRFACRCSLQKVLAAVNLLPKREIMDIVQEGGCLQTRCEQCGQLFTLSAEQLSCLGER